jgi:ABC-type nitrate/sulfonate/bicarbonate transport system permease component
VSAKSLPVEQATGRVPIASIVAPRRLTASDRIYRALKGTPLGTVIPIAIALGLWECFSDFGIIDRTFFPPPHIVARTTAGLVWRGAILTQLGITAERIAFGFAFGAAPAVVIGLLVGRFRWVSLMFEPLINLTYPIPHLAILPLLLVIFGLGSAPIIALAAIVCFYPAVVNTVAAVRQVDEGLVRMARNLGASERTVLSKIILPASLPTVFAGLRLAAGLALLGVIAGEFVAGSTGIGAQAWAYWNIYQIPNMYGALTIIVLFGFVLTHGLAYLQGRLFGWDEHGGVRE